MHKPFPYFVESKVNWRKVLRSIRSGMKDGESGGAKKDLIISDLVERLRSYEMSELSVPRPRWLAHQVTDGKPFTLDDVQACIAKTGATIQTMAQAHKDAHVITGNQAEIMSIGDQHFVNYNNRFPPMYHSALLAHELGHILLWSLIKAQNKYEQGLDKGSEETYIEEVEYEIVCPKSLLKKIDLGSIRQGDALLEQATSLGIPIDFLVRRLDKKVRETGILLCEWNYGNEDPTYLCVRPSVFALNQKYRIIPETPASMLGLKQAGVILSDISRHGKIELSAKESMRFHIYINGLGYRPVVWDTDVAYTAYSLDRGTDMQRNILFAIFPLPEK